MKSQGPSPNHPTSRSPLIELRRVSRFFRPDRAALFDISFRVESGEFVYISGPSGAGKSTLLRMLHGSEHPDTGAVFFNGHDLFELRKPAVALLRRSIGFIFQDYFLVPELTVFANVALPLEVAGKSRKAIRESVASTLELIGMSGRERELARGLSGGEQQRVAIARALVAEPEIILADEPTGSLDAYNADFVLDLLEKTAARGQAVVLATHDRMLMAARPHRTIILDRGHIVGLSHERTPPGSALSTRFKDVI